MAKENAYLRYALGFMTILLVIFGISLVLATVFILLGVMNLRFGHGGVELTAQFGNGSQLESLLSLVNSYIIFAVFYCVRLFLANIVADRIFVDTNVKIAKWSSLLLLLLAFLTKGILTIGGYSFFNIDYIVTAMMVWSIAIILAKANQIAEENEFTI